MAISRIRQDRKSNRTRWKKHTRVNRKGESNDSPEIPDRLLKEG